MPENAKLSPEGGRYDPDNIRIIMICTGKCQRVLGCQMEKGWHSCQSCIAHSYCIRRKILGRPTRKVVCRICEANEETIFVEEYPLPD